MRASVAGGPERGVPPRYRAFEQAPCHLHARCVYVHSVGPRQERANSPGQLLAGCITVQKYTILFVPFWIRWWRGRAHFLARAVLRSPSKISLHRGLLRGPWPGYRAPRSPSPSGETMCRPRAHRARDRPRSGAARRARYGPAPSSTPTRMSWPCNQTTHDTAAPVSGAPRGRAVGRALVVRRSGGLGAPPDTCGADFPGSAGLRRRPAAGIVRRSLARRVGGALGCRGCGRSCRGLSKR